jgi:hypothetical protein
MIRTRNIAPHRARLDRGGAGRPPWLLAPTLLLALALWPVASCTPARSRALDPTAVPTGGAAVAAAAAATPAAAPAGTAAESPAAAGQNPALSPLGFVSLPGFNADVWGHNGFAYVGTWGTGSNYPARCPASGVRIVDLADPRNPQVVGAVAALPGTTQEDVEVRWVETAAFRGDLLVTGVQTCVRASDAPRGLDLWDVTDPYNPRHLAFWSSGPGGSGAAGVHELSLFQRGDRAFVAAAVPYSESLEGRGDFRLVEVTDPRQPAQLSSWGATLDGGLTPRPGQVFYDHSAAVNEAGTVAILSYWDAGAILLDIADPAAPAFVGRTVYPAGSNGDTHSALLAQGEGILLTTDEQMERQNGTWGFLRLWDVRDPANPVEIGRFATPNTTALAGPGIYSAHNPLVRGATAWVSWFSDGVRVLDIADPAAPREVAAFVPPDTADPYGVYPTAAVVWGVHLAGDLLLLSDINAGLYVLEAAPR